MPINQTPVSPQQKTKLRLPIIVAILISGTIFGLGGFFLGRHTSQSEQLPIQSENTTQISPTPIVSIQTQSPVEEKTPVVSGADLQHIKFTLPSEWKSEINKDTLLLSPKTGGGYMAINVYDFSSDIGRREFFCQTTQSCIKETKFEEVSLGNISGYSASALDNSGSGKEYFGSKGNKFYIISSYVPPLPNNYIGTYQQVLNSLIF